MDIPLLIGIIKTITKANIPDNISITKKLLKPTVMRILKNRLIEE